MSEFRKRAPDEIEQFIPHDSVHAAFLRRDDIALLSSEEQEIAWIEHQINIKPFLEFLSQCESIVLED